jgi:hypothetical protein
MTEKEFSTLIKGDEIEVLQLYNENCGMNINSLKEEGYYKAKITSIEHSTKIRFKMNDFEVICCHQYNEARLNGKDIFRLINNNKQTKTNNNIMTNIKQFIKNAQLTAEEKLLRKQGFKNECGDYTQEAIDAVIQKLVKENNTYLVELATAIEKEENKTK